MCLEAGLQLGYCLLRLRLRQASLIEFRLLGLRRFPRLTDSGVESGLEFKCACFRLFQLGLFKIVGPTRPARHSIQALLQLHKLALSL